MDKGSGNYDAGTKLLEYDKDEVELLWQSFLEEDGAKDAQSAGSKDGKEKTDSQAYIVVARRGITLGRAFFLITTDAVPGRTECQLGGLTRL